MISKRGLPPASIRAWVRSLEPFGGEAYLRVAIHLGLELLGELKDERSHTSAKSLLTFCIEATREEDEDSLLARFKDDKYAYFQRRFSRSDKTYARRGLKQIASICRGLLQGTPPGELVLISSPLLYHVFFLHEEMMIRRANRKAVESMDEEERFASAYGAAMLSQRIGACPADTMLRLQCVMLPWVLGLGDSLSDAYQDLTESGN